MQWGDIDTEKGVIHVVHNWQDLAFATKFQARGESAQIGKHGHGAWTQSELTVTMRSGETSPYTACVIVSLPTGGFWALVTLKSPPSIGMAGDVIFVVYMERGVFTRIISARLADKDERRLYHGNSDLQAGSWHRANP